MGRGTPPCVDGRQDESGVSDSMDGDFRTQFVRDPAALKQVFDKRRLPADRWTLARTEAAGVRRLAAVLGIRYRPLADGEFNHTSALVLLDGEGRVLARTETLGSVPDPAFLAAVKAALAKPAG